MCLGLFIHFFGQLSFKSFYATCLFYEAKWNGFQIISHWVLMEEDDISAPILL